MPAAFLWLPYDVSVAFAGIAVGWLLATGTDVLRTWRRDEREQKAAARLVFIEMVGNMADVSAYVVHGIEAPELRTLAWEAHQGVLVKGLGMDGAMTVAMAYSALRDIARAAAYKEDFDPTGDPEDVGFIQRQMEYGRTAWRVLGPVAGFSEEAVEERIESALELEKKALEARGWTSPKTTSGDN
jgi:hypothetical protein